MRCALRLSFYAVTLWGSLNAFNTGGWTESSISLELTKTGASGEKLERYGSSVSHGVHASRETQPSRQGSTSHLSLLLSLVPIGINSVRFLFLPSSILKLHTHLPSSCSSSCSAVMFWIGYAFRCLWRCYFALRLGQIFCSFNCCLFPLSSEMNFSGQRCSWYLEMSVQWSKSDYVEISGHHFAVCLPVMWLISSMNLFPYSALTSILSWLTIKSVYFLFYFISAITIC